MDHEPEYLMCLLANGKPKWIRFSPLRKISIVNAMYHMKVSAWWEEVNGDRQIFHTWWIGYKAWLHYEKLLPDSKRDIYGGRA